MPKPSRSLEELSLSLEVKTRVVVTNRKLGKRGGVLGLAGLAALAAEVGALAPEAIDEGAATAPSKRIIKHIPNYERLKVRVGAPAAAAIGLVKLRAQCPHFSDWVTRLERLGRPIE